MTLSEIEKHLLNNYQQDFPLVSEPFKAIAEEIGTDVATVLNLLRQFSKSGIISRVGPVFRPNTIGSSTLAAMSIPERQLTAIASKISAYTEVNHNYEREHEFNLWFVVNTATPQRRDAVLREIELETGFKVLSLPLIRDYHINLGFDIDFSDCLPTRPTEPTQESTASLMSKKRPRQNRDFISVLQSGLPLVDRPYFDIALNSGLSEKVVLKLIRNMLRTGAIKRFGVVVRHHELGYRANAMCVWDIPDDEVDTIGQRIAQMPYVTLCYRRPRQPPDWPYNLFCMIHGKDKEVVTAQIGQIVEELELYHIPRSVLFSGRRFKQRGAYYRHQQDAPTDNILVAHG
ncbi:MAG: hypothetical protein QNI91_10250 [Arenicellales bacterium]|nr:hypothetical protein [Arenicellales bacterium]